MRLNLQILTGRSWVKCFSTFLILWGSNALGTIDPQLVEVFNASGWKRPVVQSTTPGTGTGGGTSGNLIVYGGIMGPVCTGETTCNNCVGDNMPCNANRISPTSLLKFRFKTDNASAIAAGSKLFFLVNSTVQLLPDSGTSTDISVNADLYITIEWGRLCEALGSDRSCSVATGSKSIQFGISTTGDTTLEESITVEVTILGDSTGSAQYVTNCKPELGGIDAPKMGFCWVQLKRGDEKVYIDEELYYGTGFNSTPDGGKYTALRVYFAEGPETGDNLTFPTVVNSSSDFKDLTFTMNGEVPTLDNNKITGLKNGTRYYFMFANVDEAGNVMYFSNYTPSSNPIFPAYLDYNFHSMMPEEVSGALEGKECFIATAAYGSPMAPQLDILRTFRDQFLKTNALGRWLVKKYYIYGPKWAKKIKQRDSVRAAVRTALSPVVSAAQWMILYGLKSFILISLMGFVVGFFIIRRVIRDHE